MNCFEVIWGEKRGSSSLTGSEDERVSLWPQIIFLTEGQLVTCGSVSRPEEFLELTFLLVPSRSMTSQSRPSSSAPQARLPKELAPKEGQIEVKRLWRVCPLSSPSSANS